MSMIFFTYRARMQARQGTEILRRAGIPVRMDRTPAQIAGNGCGYGLWVVPQKARRDAYPERHPFGNRPAKSTAYGDLARKP